MPRQLLVILSVALFFTPSRPAGGQTTRSGAAPMAMSISDAGQVSIIMGDRVVADGKPLVEYFPTPNRPADQLDLGQILSVDVKRDSPGHATVTHRYAAATVDYDYAVDGSDLTIAARIKNNDAARTLVVVDFAGLKFHFARHPVGTLSCQHYSYRLAHTKAQYYHPSLANPNGCVFVRDDTFGVSMYSRSEFDHQDLFEAVWEKNGEIPAECQTQFFTDRSVGPGQTVDIDMHFRISTDSSIPNLLEPYRRLYAGRFPRLFYEPDDRILLQYCQAAQVHITRSNPLGYDSPLHRFDSPAGVGAYVRLILPPLKKANGLGVIFWDPGGFNSVMYPPDFDVFPQAVAANIPALAAGFKDNGLRMGLCARPGDGVRRPEGKTPIVYRLVSTNEADMKTILGRFRHAIDMGFDVFYLDSFGWNDPDDIRMLKKYREAVGPKVLFYTENWTDMTLPYAGAYCEWMGEAPLWLSPTEYQALRYVNPDSTWISMSRTRERIPKKFAELKLTPLMPDGEVNYVPLQWPPDEGRRTPAPRP